MPQYPIYGKAKSSPNSLNTMTNYGLCEIRYQTEQLSILLECHSYHSQIPTDKKQKILQECLAPSQSQEFSTICATGALGSGVDTSIVRLLIHLGVSWSFLDYMPEAGRMFYDILRLRPEVSYRQYLFYL